MSPRLPFFRGCGLLVSVRRSHTCRGPRTSWPGSRGLWASALASVREHGPAVRRWRPTVPVGQTQARPSCLVTISRASMVRAEGDCCQRPDQRQRGLRRHLEEEWLPSKAAVTWAGVEWHRGGVAQAVLRRRCCGLRSAGWGACPWPHERSRGWGQVVAQPGPFRAVRRWSLSQRS